MSGPIKCFYTLGGLNYKNGFVTSCPQQSDQLHIIENANLIKPSDILNSNGFKNHRLEMMSGNWSSGCHLCKDVEQSNAGRSMRADYSAIEDDYDVTTGAIKFTGLRHVELRFSNACNMACLHCSEVYSSGWMSKLKHYNADKEDWSNNLIQLTKTMHRSSPDDDMSISISIEEMTEIVNDLNDNFPNIEKVDFAGGEVLYQKQFFPCLELLGQHPNAKNMTLCFHSNFNAKFDPVRLYELLSVFGKVTIMLSIDSGRNIYPYFRTGNWDVLKSNVDTFKALDKRKKMDINLVCTTSVYQIMDIENIIESFLSLDIDWIKSSIVYTPKYLNPAILMHNFEEYIRQDLQAARLLVDAEKIKRFANIEVYSKLRSWRKGKQHFADIDSAYTALDGIEDYIFNHKAEVNQYEAFLVYIKKTDLIWKQNFNDHFVKYKYENNKIVRKE